MGMVYTMTTEILNLIIQKVLYLRQKIYQLGHPLINKMGILFGKIFLRHMLIQHNVFHLHFPINTLVMANIKQAQLQKH